MKKGLTEIINPMRGTTPIAKVMKGAALIWERISPWYSAAIHINSFRKIVPTSTLAVRAHRLSDSAIQDIGWNGDYIDEAAAITFAQGGDVNIEFYNQINNQLDTRAPTGVISILPKMIIGGIVQKQGTFISSKHPQASALRTSLADIKPNDANIYNVLNNASQLGLGMTTSCDSGKYDVWDQGSSSTQINDPNFPVGNISRFKNGIAFTPTTRDNYYNHVNPLGHMLLEQRNFDFTLYNGQGEEFVGSDWTYRNASNVYQTTITWRTEMIIMDNAKVYDADEVRADIMTYYNLI